jgi:hypothetical protein
MSSRDANSGSGSRNRREGLRKFVRNVSRRLDGLCDRGLYALIEASAHGAQCSKRILSQ